MCECKEEGGGRSFNNSIPASPSNSACFPPSSSTIVSMLGRGYDLPRYPYLFRRATLSLTKWWPLTCRASDLSRLLQKGSAMSFGADSLRSESLGA